MNFKHISPLELPENASKIIGKDFMLVTAGNAEKNNCLTASWGGLGFMWNKPVACIVIRPQRYTKEFIDREDYFTLSFFNNEFKDMFTFCGTKSGRDYDKIKECNLTPFLTQHGSVAYEQARIVLECRKLFASPMTAENFIDKTCLDWYADGDFHVQYIAEITDCLIK